MRRPAGRRAAARATAPAQARPRTAANPQGTSDQGGHTVARPEWPATATLGEVRALPLTRIMSSPVVTAEAYRRMVRHRIRHVPVVSSLSGRLVGMFSWSPGSRWTAASKCWNGCGWSR